MAVRDFADMYTRTPRAAGLNGKGVCIGKTHSARILQWNKQPKGDYCHA